MGRAARLRGQRRPSLPLCSRGLSCSENSGTSAPLWEGKENSKSTFEGQSCPANMWMRWRSEWTAEGCGDSWPGAFICSWQLWEFWHMTKTDKSSAGTHARHSVCSYFPLVLSRFTSSLSSWEHCHVALFSGGRLRWSLACPHSHHPT